ncbi:hypothetical protein [Lichenifustis flavocetrariae]|uniref:Uncharacterized protein n=1 Tax=Lichenifustis flavocetrariae TaxID=2949735 RepID=A0AA41Z4Q3_9HYPH|nr:hypothetical protein [Lichenifustis flavocetrariae]MCW6513027.1 hypothetical protein [Lichenifustis flavocetrariae]
MKFGIFDNHGTKYAETAEREHADIIKAAFDTAYQDLGFRFLVKEL